MTAVMMVVLMVDPMADLKVAVLVESTVVRLADGKVDLTVELMVAWKVA
jgi:hypothetical protein